MGAPAKKRNPLSLKRHLFQHGDTVKMPAQGFLDLFFDAAPHLEYLFQLFELSAKAAFAKAHLTLSERKTLNVAIFSVCMRCFLSLLSWGLLLLQGLGVEVVAGVVNCFHSYFFKILVCLRLFHAVFPDCISPFYVYEFWGIFCIVDFNKNFWLNYFVGCLGRTSLDWAK